MTEIILATLLCGERLEIGKKACRPVVARCISPPNFILDFAPDCFAALLERHEPGAARFLCLPGVAAPLRFLAFSLCAFVRLPNLTRPLSQRASRTVCRGRTSAFLMNPALEFRSDVVVALDNAQQELRLFLSRNSRHGFAQMVS